MWDDEDDDRIWRVVLNHEEQYSIWPAERELPAGWREEGKRGSREECLDHIEKVWTDMRPLSVRRELGDA
jgi:MbtH protein